MKIHWKWLCWEILRLRAFYLFLSVCLSVCRGNVIAFCSIYLFDFLCSCTFNTSNKCWHTRWLLFYGTFPFSKEQLKSVENIMKKISWSREYKSGLCEMRCLWKWPKKCALSISFFAPFSCVMWRRNCCRDDSFMGI